MRGEVVRQKLRSGQRVYGSHACSLTNPVTAKMATSCNFDFVFICTEHMPIDRTETAMMCQFWAAHGVSPIVRIPFADAHWANMALDGGVQGIVAPYVETVAEVREVVGAVKYRPIKGKLLHDVLAEKHQLKETTRHFLDDFNRDSYFIIGIESVEAVRNLDALLSVPGVDGVFIGPHDLTVSMEIPTQYDHPDFIDTVESVIRRCRLKDVGAGIHFKLLDLPAETLRRFLNAGMNWLLNGADITISRDEMNRQLSTLRSISGDAYESVVPGDAVAATCIDSTRPNRSEILSGPHVKTSEAKLNIRA